MFDERSLSNTCTEASLQKLAPLIIAYIAYDTIGTWCQPVLWKGKILTEYDCSNTSKTRASIFRNAL